MSNDYDIAQIYKDMEQEIISSMQRNLSRHIQEEKTVGFDYPQWQAEKLRSLRQYQIENAKIINSYTEGLPTKVKAILHDELKQGSLQEIKKFKEALAAGYESATVMNESFFRINARKVNALMNSVNNDLKKANQACLRYADDAYRKVIFKSEMYVANSVFTEKKAIEKAIEDFEKQGIHCIEYADGSHRDIADYADMAIKTASQRAYLMGEGEMRKKIGETLIKISKHGGTCPLCAKWEGKVLIDDVYSGGTAEDGPYPLLSEAMAAGLYHPRCRHGCNTYYPEIEDIWDDKENIHQNEVLKLQENNLQDKTQNGKMDVARESQNNIGRIHKYKKGVIDLDENAQKQIHQHEAIISGNQYETAIVYDKDGNRIFTKKGTRNEVQFTNQELKQMKNGIITHNHPNNSCFSEDDIKMLRKSGANEIRAVTRSKCYSIKAPENWTQAALDYDIDSKICEYEIEFANKYRDLAAQNGENYSKYISNVFEDAVTSVAEDMGAKFSIEKR